MEKKKVKPPSDWCNERIQAGENASKALASIIEKISRPRSDSGQFPNNYNKKSRERNISN